MESLPSVLQVFEDAAKSVQANPIYAKLANAKWQSSLIAAMMQAETKGADLHALSDSYQALARQAVSQLGLNPDQPEITNLAMQVLEKPITQEIKDTGNLKGAWLSQWVQAIKAMPNVIRLFDQPDQATDSLSMTEANHYTHLFTLANEFSFLRDPFEVTKWADQLIRQSAQQTAQLLKQDGSDRTQVFQNQLNVHRKLFESAYRKEMQQWQPLLDAEPNLRNLYIQGMPLSGIEQRFAEQAQQLQTLMGVTPQDHGRGHTR